MYMKISISTIAILLLLELLKSNIHSSKYEGNKISRLHESKILKRMILNLNISILYIFMKFYAISDI